MSVNTTLPGVFLKGLASARPAANAVAGGTVYSATDTGVITQSDGSSWSTWATISSGMPDPMTTRGDLIFRNASNVTARLPIGSAGKVLSSDGTDVSWQTPAAAGATARAIAPSSDTFINDQSPTTNSDSATELSIGNAWGTASFTRFALMTFDVSTLAAKTIGSAVLHLVTGASVSGFPANVQVREVLRAYNPTQVTWNAYSTGNNWTTAGAESVGNDIAAEYYGDQRPAGLVAQTIDLDITRLVQAYADASTSTLRVIIGTTGTQSGNAVTVCSLEYATASKRPVLRVVA